MVLDVMMMKTSVTTITTVQMAVMRRDVVCFHVPRRGWPAVVTDNSP